jgi:hypothetical protein
MDIQNMLARFRPLYAPDGGAATGEAPGGEAAAAVAAIVNADKGAGAEPVVEEETYDLPDDIEAGAAEEPEFEDYDLDGLKVKVPKGQAEDLKKAALRQADYTNGKKELARAQRESEAAKTRYETAAAMDDTFREGVYHLRSIDSDLTNRAKYFQTPEFRQLREDDPLKARSLYDDFQMDKDKRGELASLLGQMQQERASKEALAAQEQSEANRTLREHALQKVSKEIPGWNADRQAKVRTAAIARGYAAEAVDSITDPLHWADLYYADIGRQAVAANARRGAGAVRPQTPGSTRTIGQGGGAVTGNANARLDKANSDDYVAMRRQQMAKG